MRAPIARIQISAGNPGWYDPLTNIHLTITRPQALVYEGQNVSNIKTAVRHKTVFVVEGELEPKVIVQEPVVQEEVREVVKPVEEEKIVEEVKVEEKPQEEIKEDAVKEEVVEAKEEKKPAKKTTRKKASTKTETTK